MSSPTNPSRKRKRLHLIEDSPEPDPHTSHSNDDDYHPSTSAMPRQSSASNDDIVQPAPELPPSGLNRGFACLGCRKRKSKCDANKPCDQCIKAKMQCVYDERPQKRPTELLKDRIRELEEKVRQLERQNPGLAAALAKSQSVTPASAPASSPSSSRPRQAGSDPSPSWVPPQVSDPNYPFPTNAAGLPAAFMSSDPSMGMSARQFSQGLGLPGMQQLMMSNNPMRPGSGLDSSIFALTPDTSNDPLPADVDQNELLAIFIDHRHQAYCDFSIPRFLQSLNAPAHSSAHSSSSSSSHPNSPTTPSRPNLVRPHSSLLNAIYLLGAFFSAASSSPGKKSYANYEPLFLHRARQGLAASLENAECLTDAIQAASLVAMYLYAKGRVLEGYYLSCANARFAVGCGLLRCGVPVFGAKAGGKGKGKEKELRGGDDTMEEDDDDDLGITTMPLLDHPRDAIELGERIHIWWQVWMVDQCGAISTNLPPALTDSSYSTNGNGDPLARIETPLPPQMNEFEDPSGQLSMGAIHSSGGAGMEIWGEWETLRMVYDVDTVGLRKGAEMQETVMGRSAMVVKAIELFSRAWKLSKHDMKDAAFRHAFSQTDTAIRSFSSSLPRTLTSSGTLSHLLFLPHSFALAAIIQLHWIVAAEHHHLHPSYQNCLNAAIDMVAIIDVIGPEDYGLLELHIGTCWKLTVDVLLREYNRVHMIDEGEARAYQNALEKVQEATRQLSLVFPVLLELWKLNP